MQSSKRKFKPASFHVDKETFISTRVPRVAMKYGKIPWDTEYLGLDTYELYDFTGAQKNAPKLYQDWRKAHKQSFVFARSEYGDRARIETLSASGLTYAEVSAVARVILPMRVSKNTDGTRSELAQEAQISRVSELAAKSFTADRYHMDRRLPRVGADRRFAMWVRNSFAQGEKVYVVYDRQDHIIGFFILALDGHEANTRLIALSPRYRGKGLGKRLYEHMFTQAQRLGAKTLTAVITITNIPVVNIYSSFGAKFGSFVVIFHDVI